MPYSRKSAVDYARAYWNTACHDGKISLIGAHALNVESEWKSKKLAGPRTAWSVLFQPFGTEVEAAVFVGPTPVPQLIWGWKGLGDCAHFMSRCLNAAGLKDVDTDYVPYLFDYLKNLRITKTLAREVSEDRAARIIRKRIMKPGDVILYLSPPGGELGGGYVHSALFVTESTISCHTICRFDEDWNIHPGEKYTFTLIHFGEDDPSNPLLDAKISGWWNMKWRGEDYYYYFDRGKVAYTQTKPSGVAPIHFGSGSGYYFFNLSGSISLYWTKTGSVEEGTLDASGKAFTGKWNDSETLTGTKM